MVFRNKKITVFLKTGQVLLNQLPKHGKLKFMLCIWKKRKIKPFDPHNFFSLLITMQKYNMDWKMEFWDTVRLTSIRIACFPVDWFAKFLQILTLVCYVIREQLRVDKGGKKITWCMNQYKRMFSGCKTPGQAVDKLNDYFKTGWAGCFGAKQL